MKILSPIIQPEDCTVLYVEDDPSVRLGSTQAMQLAGFTVRSFGAAEQVLRLIGPGECKVLVTDVRLPGIDGLELLKRVHAVDPNLPVIVVTGHGDISMAVQAMLMGAYDFVEQPFSPEQLTDVVGRAIEKRMLSLEVDSLRRKLESYHTIEAKLIGKSPSIERLRRLILSVADTDADVLISGETGAGKELVARCLHDHSRRRDANFVAINCGGMPEQLFESEVFGHEAGAFTGAAKRRIGKLELAGSGTLFLDEIETMPMSLQVKLLRTLQERTFERLGSNDLVPMKCRVIAATKADLLERAREKTFRADLYYRLNVVPVDIPALRDRREDIPLLFSHFVNQAALRYERSVPEVGAETIHQLMARSWPGNVRELRNVADRLVLGLADPGADSGAGRLLDEQVAAFERHLIQEALAACGGRASSASEMLRLPKKALYDRMKRLGLSGDEYRSPG